MLIRDYSGKWIYGEIFNSENSEWYSYTNSRLHKKQLEPLKHRKNQPTEEDDELQAIGEEVVPQLPAFVCPKICCTTGNQSCVLPGLICDGTLNKKGTCNFRRHEDFERHLAVPSPGVTVNGRDNYSDEDFSFNEALRHVRFNIETPISKLWNMFGVLLQFGELNQSCDTWLADYTRVLRICQAVYNELIEHSVKLGRPHFEYHPSRPIQARAPETDAGPMTRVDQYDRDAAGTAKEHIMSCSLKVGARKAKVHTRAVIELDELNALADVGDPTAKGMLESLKRNSLIT